MGELYIEFETSGGGTVNNADHHLPADPDNKAKGPTIVFEAPDKPKGGINNTGQIFPTGMTEFAADQTPKPQG